MKQSNKTVIIWSTSVIDLMEGKPIGGVAVQMYFWAKAFAEQGWKVYSFTDRHKKELIKENVSFLPKWNIKRINVLSEWWYAFHFISKLRPEIVVYRGANRELLPTVKMSNLFGTKLLFFSASDVNFEPGKELVGSEFNRLLYQRAVKHCKYFVVQNKHQQDTLQRNYGKVSLQQFNIWGQINSSMEKNIPTSDTVWVANFRRLKRAEWVLNAAEELTNFKFVLAGGSSGDESYFNEMRARASSLGNVEFLGGKSFFYTCELVAKSQALLCTSTFEGFPNTFLQAWSHGLPVISTVDPSGIISKYKLGEVIRTEEELTSALKHILDDKEYYQQLQRNVNKFFKENNSSISGYNRVIQYIAGKQ